VQRPIAAKGHSYLSRFRIYPSRPIVEYPILMVRPNIHQPGG
jgi:hypothetical protein